MIGKAVVFEGSESCSRETGGCAPSHHGPWGTLRIIIFFTGMDTEAEARRTSFGAKFTSVLYMTLTDDVPSALQKCLLFTIRPDFILRSGRLRLILIESETSADAQV